MKSNMVVIVLLVAVLFLFMGKSEASDRKDTPTNPAATPTPTPGAQQPAGTTGSAGQYDQILGAVTAAAQLGTAILQASTKTN